MNRILNHQILYWWCSQGKLLCLLLGVISVSLAGGAVASQSSMDHVHESPRTTHTSVPLPGQWEGSPEAIAYSEFNHALAGVGVVVVGLSELRTAMGWTALAWLRILVPMAMVGWGLFLMIWSDHEAWPIGSWTFLETFSGKDPEMVQHKVFGVLSIGVGCVEWLRQAGNLPQWSWSTLLPGFALIGGSLLFLHMHGPHPAGHQIQTHHNVMGTMALIGGLAWFSAEWMRTSNAARLSSNHYGLKVLWGVLVVTIGLQLIFYSES